jgi:hypothetical protein
MEDLREFYDRDYGFVERVRTNTTRYIGLFSAVIDANLPQPSVDLREYEFSTYDIMMQQRRQNAVNSHQALVVQGLIKAGDSNTNMGIPPEL